MISKETIDSAVEEFYQSDDVLIDLTDPKTFIVASVLSVIFGFMIGLGYQMIFTSMDCSSVYNTLGDTPTRICFPNTWGEHKLTIMIITLITGILVGASPQLIKRYMRGDYD